jgi:predicted nucleic acid-binding protein
MALYFVDTWFLIARVDKSDPSYRNGVRLEQRLGDASFVTHDGVLTEMLTYFSGYGDYWRGEVASFVRQALASEQYTVVPLSRDVFLDALSMYERRLDKAYSLVDCMSMRLMLRTGITHILSNDHHFSQEGFVLVNQ